MVVRVVAIATTAASILFVSQVLQAKDRLNAIMTLDGQCDRLIAGLNDITPRCKGTLANTSYTSERSGFYFVATDGAIITFSGEGNRQINRDKDNVVQPVDVIVFSFSGATERMSAVGACSFGNPYKGPTVIECSADTGKAKFEGKFTSNGVKPDVRKIP